MLLGFNCTCFAVVAIIRPFFREGGTTICLYSGIVSRKGKPDPAWSLVAGQTATTQKTKNTSAAAKNYDNTTANTPFAPSHQPTTTKLFRSSFWRTLFFFSIDEKDV
jgi:hypothetical protein